MYTLIIITQKVKNAYRLHYFYNKRLLYPIKTGKTKKYN